MTSRGIWLSEFASASFFCLLCPPRSLRSFWTFYFRDLQLGSRQTGDSCGALSGCGLSPFFKEAIQGRVEEVLDFLSDLCLSTSTNHTRECYCLCSAMEIGYHPVSHLCTHQTALIPFSQLSPLPSHPHTVPVLP